jgi:hypothetical protein
MLTPLSPPPIVFVPIRVASVSFGAVSVVSIVFVLP